jgi:hypothetical protein
MADPQHLRWLMEGVAAWNARRAASSFVPNLDRADIAAAFAASGDERAPLAGINLRGANLGRSRLEGTDLSDADLSGAYLTGVSLRHSWLRQANLRNATLADANMVESDCRGADFRGADLDRADFGRALLNNADLRRAHMEKTYFGGAELREADVRTWRGANHRTPRFTYLSGVRGLTQAQADAMRGDRGVTLPDGLVPPEAWPRWRDFEHVEQPEPAVSVSYAVDRSGPGPTAARAVAARRPELSRQVHLLVRTAPTAQLTADSLSTLIAAAVSEYRASAGNDLPDEVLFMDDLAQTLRALGQRLGRSNSSANDTSALEAEIERLHAIIAGLTAQLEGASAERESRFVAAFLEKGGSALGGALFGGLGTSLVAGAGFLLGAYAPEAVTAFGELMGRLTQAAAAT